MNAQTKLDATATETLVSFLVDKFGVPRCNVEHQARLRSGGRYRVSERLIRLPVNHELWLVAHEFTHHLNHVVNDRRGHRLEPHGESFFYNLLRVIEAIGIDDYPWPREYQRLQNWNIRRQS